MLTGEPPFTAPNSARLMIKIVTEAAPRPTEKRPEIPAALEELVLRCLEKEPSGRPPSADALIRALDALPPSQPTESPALSTTMVDAELPPRAPTPRSVPARPVVPPSRPTGRPIQLAPVDLPFDHVFLADGRRLSAAAFFDLPLSERIQHVIARTVMFFRDGIEVDRQDALARMRVRSARSGA
jgi:serine/threonine protein kinase